MRFLKATKRASLALSALAALALVLIACSRKPHPEDHAASRSGAAAQRTTVQTSEARRDTVLRDTTRILGTPGSPTGANSRGMPGEKPIPGTK